MKPPGLASEREPGSVDSSEERLLREAAYVEEVALERPATLSGMCGPYEILGPLGTGGMGEVYRARDPRLRREVAIKVLSPEFVARSDRARRFEREARATAALKHENVVAVLDVGRQAETPYVVFELLEGETLRSRLERGTPPLATALDWVVQICLGLEAAHRAGIVHRDLKPENIHVGRDGIVKILDFGLAQVANDDGQGKTEPGRILGTVGYMSPEQVRGEATDERSDVFSLGAVLFEMLTGSRPFRARSGAEVMAAILNADPLADAVVRDRIPAPLLDVIHRCLEKEPARRPASAREVLQAIRFAAPVALSARPVRLPKVSSRLALVVGAAVVALLVVAVATRTPVARPSPPAAPPTFQRLTFRRGLVTHARLTGDGRTVLYSAVWEGRPTEVFSMRPGSAEGRALGIEASLLAVSRADDMALALAPRKQEGYIRSGTLAQAGFLGGAPRKLLDDVQEADWSPDGKLAVVRFLDGHSVLEFPPGKVAYQSKGWLGELRIAPSGNELAVIDHPVPLDDAGNVVLIGPNGSKTLSGNWSSVRGTAWSSDGTEVWFTAAQGSLLRELRAVSRDGRERLVGRVPGSMTLQDVAQDGRVLITMDDERVRTHGLAPGEAAERDLSWLDYGAPADLTPDGRLLLLVESGTGGGPGFAAYARPTNGGDAVRIASGVPTAVSRDGSRALVISENPARLRDVPVGTGQPTEIDLGDVQPSTAQWLDSKRILVLGSRPGQPAHLHLRDESGALKALAPEIVPTPNTVVSSPDGKRLVLLDLARRPQLVSVPDGTVAPFPALHMGETPSRWTADGRAVYACRYDGLPADLVRIDVASGQRETIRRITLSDPAGVAGLGGFYVSEDGRAYVYNYVRSLSDLYLVDGWK